MRVAELKGKNLVIWGTGKEGLAAANLVLRKLPGQNLVFVDEGQGPKALRLADKDFAVARDPKAIEKALADADVLIKSPGVSLYHPLLANHKNLRITSLLNLWLAEPRKARVLGVTGTKGKSTTATLLNHVLNALGKKSAILGNIGTPVTEGADTDADFFVVEVSSYQAANLSENFDLGILTSLFPEHLDWHKSLENYYGDKSNLLAHAKLKIIESSALQTLKKLNIVFEDAIVFNAPENFHFREAEVLHGSRSIGTLDNAFLLRAHNQGNVCAVLAAIDALGLDPASALKAMKDYHGLPHRQSELGEKNGVLYVDDSISTTPQSAIAAMEAYEGRPITLIAGGFDRGIDYEPLIAYVLQKKINAVVCLDDSGRRIFEGLRQSGFPNALFTASMREAVSAAKQATPEKGIILLSPAAPSYGMFKDFVDRAAHFAKESGF